MYVIQKPGQDACISFHKNMLKYKPQMFKIKITDDTKKSDIAIDLVRKRKPDIKSNPDLMNLQTVTFIVYL